MTGAAHGGPGSGAPPADGRGEAAVAGVALAVRAWAALDLVVTGCLAAPPAGRALFRGLDRVDRLLGGTGMPAGISELAWLFVEIAGVLGVLWALVRLARPTRVLGCADAIARGWVGWLIVRLVSLRAVPLVFAGFVLTEWGGAASQAWALRPRRRRRDAG
jgi:hypothetical protein